MNKQETSSMRRNRMIADTAVHIILGIMAIIWIFPIFWVVVTSFRGESTGPYSSTFLPKQFTLQNYVNLFTDKHIYFTQWFANTLIVAIATCIIATFYVLCVSYSFSRLRFKARKPFMNVGMILTMFPGFMSMTAVYNILKAFGLNGSLLALVLVYSSSQCLQYHIAKGFFDTIPKAIDEAAWIDGATKWDVFTRITIPLSKPILIYTVLTSFMAPWIDFIFARIILGQEAKKWTISIGMWDMTQTEKLQQYFTMFCAAAVIVSIPIALLFIFMQKYYVEGMSAGAVKG